MPSTGRRGPGPEPRGQRRRAGQRRSPPQPAGAPAARSTRPPPPAGRTPPAPPKPARPRLASVGPEASGSRPYCPVPRSRDSTALEPWALSASPTFPRSGARTPAGSCGHRTFQKARRWGWGGGGGAAGARGVVTRGRERGPHPPWGCARRLDLRPCCRPGAGLVPAPHSGRGGWGGGSAAAPPRPRRDPALQLPCSAVSSPSAPLGAPIPVLSDFVPLPCVVSPLGMSTVRGEGLRRMLQPRRPAGPGLVTVSAGRRLVYNSHGHLNAGH